MRNLISAIALALLCQACQSEPHDWMYPVHVSEIDTIPYIDEAGNSRDTMGFHIDYRSPVTADSFSLLYYVGETPADSIGWDGEHTLICK